MRTFVKKAALGKKHGNEVGPCDSPWFWRWHFYVTPSRYVACRIILSRIWAVWRSNCQSMWAAWLGTASPFGQLGLAMPVHLGSLAWQCQFIWVAWRSNCQSMWAAWLGNASSFGQLGLAMPVHLGSLAWQLPVHLGSLAWQLPVHLGSLAWQLPVHLGSLAWQLPVHLGSLAWQLPVHLGSLAWHWQSIWAANLCNSIWAAWPGNCQSIWAAWLDANLAFPAISHLVFFLASYAHFLSRISYFASRIFCRTSNFISHFLLRISFFISHLLYRISHFLCRMSHVSHVPSGLPYGWGRYFLAWAFLDIHCFVLSDTYEFPGGGE